MVETADVVVIGSGAFGSSIAFHLVQRGLRRVTLVDRHAIGSQTSARAAGNAAQARGHALMAHIARDSIERFHRFSDETGEQLEFFASDSLAVSHTPNGAGMLHNLHELGKANDLDVALIDAGQARALSPLLDVSGATAILHTPGDIYLEPAQLPLAYARAFERLGGTLLPHTPVIEILRDGTAVSGVRSGRGAIHAPVVVDAAGAWTRLVAELAGIRVPLVPVRHQLLVTRPINGIAPLHPVVRFVDFNTYTRPSLGGMLIGAYEPHPEVIDMAAQPAGLRVADLALDLPMLEGVAERVAERFPVLREQRLLGRYREVRGGLPTMTPDGLPIIGPAPAVAGMFVASGCCVGGFSISPSVGALLAGWIVDGRPPLDLAPLALNRFSARYDDDQRLVDDCLWEYSHVYDMHREPAA